jgi:hypothetical protein
MTMFRSATTVLLSLLLCTAPSRSASVLTGTWRGTYNSMPAQLLPDGSYPERVNGFQLNLRVVNGAVLGRFEPIGAGIAPAQDIRNYAQVGSRHCFDITAADGDDMRWCLRLRGDRLEGVWNRGPEGGPIAAGLGIGARLFKVSAARSK